MRAALVILPFVLLGPVAGALAADGWTVLFDGTSTAAWRGYKHDTFPATGWVVEGGALKTVEAKDAVDIITVEKYRSFELELQWKLAPSGNSGVLYRVVEGPEQTWHSAPEMQILDDPAYVGQVKPGQLSGALYDLYPPMAKATRPAGEWNQIRLVVRGDAVEHWLNGVKVVACTLGTPDFKARVAESKFKVYPGFAMAKEGHIALQHHGHDVFFRNVRVRRLAD